MDWYTRSHRTETAPTTGTGHYRHPRFFESFAKLPSHIKEFSRENFRRMVANPQQVSLKPLPHAGSGEDVWSAQVGNRYRALGVRVHGQFVWYWIGTHEEYNRRKDSPPPDMSEFEMGLAATQRPPQTKPSVA